MEKFNALERSNEMLRKMIENERSHQRENEKKRKLEVLEHVTKIKELQKKLEDKNKDVKGKANVEKDNAKTKSTKKRNEIVLQSATGDNDDDGDDGSIILGV